MELQFSSDGTRGLRGSVAGLFAGDGMKLWSYAELECLELAANILGITVDMDPSRFEEHNHTDYLINSLSALTHSTGVLRLSKHTFHNSDSVKSNLGDIKITRTLVYMVNIA